VRRHLEPLALRDLYASSRFAVVPLREIEFDAGAQAALEAMAMGKPVILTRTLGQEDLILTDGAQGVYVKPDDEGSLRRAIQALARDPSEADRMGQAGRRLAVERHSVDGYARRLASIVRET
jgi:glycosyltransferase involved in cell wall biosynthesis